jgi:hypothetical protein
MLDDERRKAMPTIRERVHGARSLRPVGGYGQVILTMPLRGANEAGPNTKPDQAHRGDLAVELTGVCAGGKRPISTAPYLELARRCPTPAGPMIGTEPMGTRF